jgi:hypothetical protein
MSDIVSAFPLRVRTWIACTARQCTPFHDWTAHDALAAAVRAVEAV